VSWSAEGMERAAAVGRPLEIPRHGDARRRCDTAWRMRRLGGACERRKGVRHELGMNVVAEQDAGYRREGSRILTRVEQAVRLLRRRIQEA
jgi:hypothetical protein